MNWGKKKNSLSRNQHQLIQTHQHPCTDIQSCISRTQKQGTRAHLLADRRLSRDSTPSPARSEGSSQAQQYLDTSKLLNVQNEILSHFCAHKQVTYPCCVLTEVTAFVLYAVGVPDPLQKLHLLYDVLPFLSGTEGIWKMTEAKRCLAFGPGGDCVCACVKDCLPVQTEVVFFTD